jgi:hypothetical protein
MIALGGAGEEADEELRVLAVGDGAQGRCRGSLERRVELDLAERGGRGRDHRGVGVELGVVGGDADAGVRPADPAHR